MLSIIIAIIIIIIIITIYILTRGLPPPNPVITKCTTDSDCSSTDTCTDGVCSDPIIAKLIPVAQAAVKELYSEISTFPQQTKATMVQHVQDLNTASQKINVPISSNLLQTFYNDMDTASNNLISYSNQFLAIPNCTSSTCGAYTETMALTPNSSQATIISVGEDIANLSNELTTSLITQTIIDDFQNILDDLNNTASTHKIDLDSATTQAATLVSNDKSTYDAYVLELYSLAKNASMTGYALYHHYISN